MKKVKIATCTNLLGQAEIPRDKSKSYPHGKRWIYRKNRVIHEVIHVIHRKSYNLRGLHSKRKEQLFCAVAIKMGILSENDEKHLTDTHGSFG
ncbi:hypothetical protein AALB53_01825 [Lachnospiraceae bacterium 47-T17]